MELFEQIIIEIKKKYIDLKSPEYFFLFKELERKPYEDFILSLKEKDFVCKEDTDLNYMVCQYFYLKKNNKVYSIYLSLVGRYTVLITTISRKITYIQFNTEVKEEKEIIHALKCHKIILLDKELLEKEIDFTPIRSVEYKKATFFNALFSDDLPPWK